MSFKLFLVPANTDEEQAGYLIKGPIPREGEFIAFKDNFMKVNRVCYGIQNGKVNLVTVAVIKPPSML